MYFRTSISPPMQRSSSYPTTDRTYSSYTVKWTIHAHRIATSNSWYPLNAIQSKNYDGLLFISIRTFSFSLYEFQSVSNRSFSVAECTEASEHLLRCIKFAHDVVKDPPIAHYHADMSKQYKTETLRAFVEGRIGILCATEAAGMVIDFE